MGPIFWLTGWNVLFELDFLATPLWLCCWISEERGELALMRLFCCALEGFCDWVPTPNPVNLLKEAVSYFYLRWEPPAIRYYYWGCRVSFV